MSFSINARKSLFFYFGYSVLYFIIHMAITSSVSFFHFLLEHDMATIDGWISKNRWELLVVAKSLSFFICLKFLNLNYREKISFWDELKAGFNYPTQKGILFSLFLVGVVTVVSKYFYAPANIAVDNEGEFVSSFFGIIIFLHLDMTFLYLLSVIYKVGDSDKRLLFLGAAFLFAFATHLTIPYLGVYLILALLHFITLYHFSLTNRYSDGVFYCFATVAPLNSLLGLNLFSGWEENRSFELQFFLFAVFIWSVGFAYDRFSRLN